MGWEGTSVAVAALMMPFTGGLGGQTRLVGGRVAERSLGQPWDATGVITVAVARRFGVGGVHDEVQPRVRRERAEASKVSPARGRNCSA